MRPGIAVMVDSNYRGEVLSTWSITLCGLSSTELRLHAAAMNSQQHNHWCTYELAYAERNRPSRAHVDGISVQGPGPFRRRRNS